MTGNPAAVPGFSGAAESHISFWEMSRYSLRNLYQGAKR